MLTIVENVEYVGSTLQTYSNGTLELTRIEKLFLGDIDAVARIVDPAPFERDQADLPENQRATDINRIASARNKARRILCLLNGFDVPHSTAAPVQGDEK